MRRKILLVTISLCAISVGFAIAVLIKKVPLVETKQFGVTFSKPFAEKLGLDWKKNYEEIFTDLGIRHLRIPVYWPEIEPEKGRWVFNDIDWQLEKAKEYDAKVILAIGRKLPRWPECHEPEWAKNLNEEEKQELILEMIKNVIRRYDSHPAVSTWQVENEPFLPFGECPAFNVKFLDKEIDLVKGLSNKPIIVSDSGEFGIWLPAAKRADIFGSTLYRHVWTKLIGHFTYPLPPAFFRLKQSLLKLFIDQKPMIVVELQAEPWQQKALYETSIEEHLVHMNPGRFNKILEYIEGTGFDTFYFWGVEWWYWLKQNGHPEMWDMAKDAIKM